MAQLISASDAVYKRSRNSWQDTSAPPNILIQALGPGRTSLTLQFNLDIGNQPYHRESMKGQTADMANLQPLIHLPAPPLLALVPDETSGEVVHRDSMKGQVVDPQNWLLGAAPIFASPGQPGSIVVNPVFNKHPVQDTTILRNPVIDVSTATPPFHPPVFEEEQTYRHDSLSGQYARTGAVVIIGVPAAFNEIYTFVSRLKSAQEPFIHPNALLLGLAPIQPPLVQRQSEDLQWKAKAAQEPYQFPNLALAFKPPTEPFVFKQTEDLQWKAHSVQATYDYPNAAILGLPPNYIFPFIQHQYEDLQWRAKKTQEHFDFPNILIIEITPLPPVLPSAEVPYVLGLTQAQATTVLNYYGFQNVAIVFAYDTISAPGTVLGQSPSPYVIWPQGNAVILTVSEGPYVPPAAPLPPLHVTTRQFSLEEMVSREWGPSFRAPDHRVYVFQGRGFDSTDMGNTGIYKRGIEVPPVIMPPFPPMTAYTILDQYGNPILNAPTNQAYTTQ